MPSKQIALAVNMPEKEVIKIQEEFAIKVPVEKWNFNKNIIE